MKSNNSNYYQEINKNRNPKNIDGFWDDCIKDEPILNNMPFNSSSTKPRTSDYENNINKNIKKIECKNNLYEQHHKSGIINNCYKRLCEKIPNLYQEEKNNISKKLKIKKSMKRSILLYSYGLEVQKANRSNASKNKLLKEQEELKLCTWKPKLNNYKKVIKTKIQKGKNNNEYKSNKSSERKMIELLIDSECTFLPKINENSNISLKKMFNKSKSVALYTHRGNSSFILRYKKARDEHMIRRFKQLSEKDDSYDNSFIELTSRVCDKSYKNYLNVNNNIQIYDNSFKKKNNNNMIFNVSKVNNTNLSNSSLNINNGIVVPNINKSKKYYIGLLKKQLRLMDLEI